MTFPDSQHQRQKSDERIDSFENEDKITSAEVSITGVSKEHDKLPIRDEQLICLFRKSPSL